MPKLDFDTLLDEVLQESGMDDEMTGYTDQELAEELKLEDDDDDMDDELQDLDDETDDESEPDDDDIDDVMDDLGDLTDDDLDQVAKDLDNDDLDDEDDADSDDEQVRLNPEEEIEADNLMQVAGTASLIRSEMNMDERAEFLENTKELNIAMLEGFVNDSVVEEMREMTEAVNTDSMFQEAKIYSKNTIRLNKQARLAQLFSIAVYSSARAHNDPEYKKWKKARKIAKYYSKNMRRRYKSEATKRMRVLFARLKNSKSSIVKNLGKKVDNGK